MFITSGAFRPCLNLCSVDAEIRNRLALGNSGDVKPIGEGVSGMRIDIGPGYRVYFLRRGLWIVVLLCGGDQGTQARDIKTAKTIAAQWKG